MARIPTMQGLLTLDDPDEQDPNGYWVSVCHDAVLSDGRQVVLLDDRGWSTSRPIDERTIDEVELTARTVVGPDQPPAGRTRAEIRSPSPTGRSQRPRPTSARRRPTSTPSWMIEGPSVCLTHR